MEVHLLAWVVLFDEFSTSHKIVDTVLDRVDTARDRLLGYANRVPETPAKKHAAWSMFVGRAGHVVHIECFNGRYTRGHVQGLKVNVAYTATGDEQHARNLLGHEQRTRGVALVVAHALDNISRIRCSLALGSIVVPCVDIAVRRSVESFAILGECNTMIQLTLLVQTSMATGLHNGRTHRVVCHNVLHLTLYLNARPVPSQG